MEKESQKRNPSVPFSVDYDKKGFVSHLSGKLTDDIRNSFEQNSREFLMNNKILFGFKDLSDEFVEEKLTTDHYGAMHLTLQQVYKKIPVLHHLIKVHMSTEGSLSGISG